MSTAIRKSTRFQLSDLYRAILVYYIVIAAIHICVGISDIVWMAGRSAASGGYNVVMSSNGMDMITAIFLFVVGLCSFKENFGMLAQNSFSRRSVFAGRMVSFGLVALGMTILDHLLIMVLNALGGLSAGIVHASTLSSWVYGLTGVGGMATELVFTFVLYMAVLCIGYFLTILFYRLDKLGKILVGAGVPALWMIALPALDNNFFGGRISAALARAFGAAMGVYLNGEVVQLPWLGVLTLTVMAVLFGLFSWLLLRRATVRK